MGSSSLARWKPPSDLYIVMDYKYCRVWVRRHDKVEHLEEYTIRVYNKHQLEEYQKMFALRLGQPFFPNNLYFINDSSTLLCGGSQGGSILIQRIPYRLCQFTNIFYQESVSMLFFCFKAYRLLHQTYGLFRIKSTMIGLDQLFQIKVWHHTDFSSPYPQDPYCRATVQMISSIVKSIENVSECPYHIPRFSEYLEIKKIDLFGFQLALKMLQDYANEYLIKVQSKFSHIEKYLKQAEGMLPYSSKIISMSSTPQKSKNRSLNKFSFKNNQVIEVEDHKNQGNFPTNIYYNTNTNHHLASRHQTTKFGLPLKNQPQSKIGSEGLKDSAQNSSNFRSNFLEGGKSESIKTYCSNFSQYGLQKLRKLPSSPHSRHGRKDSKLELRQKWNKASFNINPTSHTRTVSDYTGLNRQIKRGTKVKRQSAYEDNNTQTRSGQGSVSGSLKTLISYSFSVDDQLRNDMVNMLRYREG